MKKKQQAYLVALDSMMGGLSNVAIVRAETEAQARTFAELHWDWPLGAARAVAISELPDNWSYFQ